MKFTYEDWFVLIGSAIAITIIAGALVLVLTGCSVRVFSPGNDDADKRYMTIETQE